MVWHVTGTPVVASVMRPTRCIWLTRVTWEGRGVHGTRADWLRCRRLRCMVLAAQDAYYHDFAFSCSDVRRVRIQVVPSATVGSLYNIAERQMFLSLVTASVVGPTVIVPTS